MNYWILTDTHFGHEKMHENCGRPHDFEERILCNTRKVVKEADVLIHIGDFCIGNDAHWHKEFISSCAGKKWLVLGNHDHKSKSWYHRAGWDFVGNQVVLNMLGAKIMLSHKPVSDPGDCVNIHGHHHNTRHHPEDVTDTRHKLVFIEHDYRPISLRRVVEDWTNGR